MEQFIHIAVIIIVIVCFCVEFHRYRVYLKNKREMEKYKGDVVLSTDFGKVLVIYYSLSGRTKDIAYTIMGITDGDIYEIKTLKKIKCYPCMYIRSKIQMMFGKYPEIIKDFPDINLYDTIFVGMPVWWYRMATPVHEFLKSVDFKGKTVIPFSTQGSNYGETFKELKEYIKNAKILQEESFNNLDKKYDRQVKNKIITWLNNVKSDRGGGKVVMKQ